MNMHLNLRRVFYIASTLLLAASSAGCAIAPSTDSDEAVGEAAEKLNGWVVQNFSSTNDPLIGFNTNVQLGSWSCFLLAVGGNLQGGNEFDVKDFRSEASVGEKQFGGNTFWIQAEGGAYTDNNNQRVFANHPVLANVACVNATSTTGTWSSFAPQFGVAPPVRVADLDSTHRRQCFLSGLQGELDAYGKDTDFAKVAEVTAADATHPTPGWYVESNLLSEKIHGAAATVSATCVDFPALQHFFFGEFSAPVGGSVTNTLTSGTGVKACGLTKIQGAFNKNNFTDGALITNPSTANGQWTMTVTNGKRARGLCVD